MSEIQSTPNSNPEKQRRITDNCDTCKKDYELTPNNTFLFHYAGQEELDNMFCTCPHCKSKIRIFIGDDTFRQAVDNGIEPICDDKYAPEDLYKKWCALNGIELPKTYELTDRHNKLIGHFGLTMANMPDDLLYDELTSDHGRPHPTRWID